MSCRLTRLRSESWQLGPQALCSARRQPIWMMLSAITQGQPIAACLQSLGTGSDSSVALLQHAYAAFASGPPAHHGCYLTTKLLVRIGSRKRRHYYPDESAKRKLEPPNIIPGPPSALGGS